MANTNNPSVREINKLVKAGKRLICEWSGCPAETLIVTKAKDHWGRLHVKGEGERGWRFVGSGGRIRQA